MIRFLFAALLLISFRSNCQNVIDSIYLKYGKIQISSIALRDSLFLRVHSIYTSKDQYFWLPKEGALQKFDLNELDLEFIIAITKSKEGIIYYYLNKNSKKIELSSFQVSVSGMKKPSTNPIEIDGRFVGSYVDSALHILTFNKKEKFVLTDTQFKEGTKVGERDFPLSINLSNYKAHQIALVDEGGYQSPLQSKALVKIYNRKKDLIVVADDPFQQFKNEQNKFFTTTVVRIDKQTKKAVTNSLFEQRQENFRSVVWGDYLFKLTYDTRNGVDGIELVVFQLDNLKNKKIQHIPFKTINAIARLGDANRTIELSPEGKKRRKVEAGKNPSPFVLIDSLNNNNLVLMIGSNFEPNSGIPIVAPNGLALFVITASMQEVGWGGSNQLYTYLSGDLKNDFVELDLKKISPGIIDKFEMAKDDAHQRFAYKGYARFDNKIYCFYLPQKSKFVRIMTFPTTH